MLKPSNNPAKLALSLPLNNIKCSDWISMTGGSGGGSGWYIQCLKQIIGKAYEESGGENVLVIGNSAGGWLAHTAMAGGVWNDEEGIKRHIISLEWTKLEGA
eukprot:15364562-Ditylum_brightwellii.AAC.2